MKYIILIALLFSNLVFAGTLLEKEEQLAKQGDQEAQYQLYIKYYEKDGNLAVHWLTEAAKQGHTQAQFELGRKYLFAQMYVKQSSENLELMIHWLTAAAKQNHVTSQFTLGMMHYLGKESFTNRMMQQEQKDMFKNHDPKGIKEAKYWFTRAAKQNHAVAQFVLGMMHFKGHGFPQSDKKAKYLWKKSAAQGHKMAIEKLETFFK